MADICLNVKFGMNAVNISFPFFIFAGNQNLKITINENSTLQMLREELKKQTGILPENQKITFRGIMKENEKTLKELKVGDGRHLFLLNYCKAIFTNLFGLI